MQVCVETKTLAGGMVVDCRIPLAWSEKQGRSVCYAHPEGNGHTRPRTEGASK